jgi:hypothetical protein
MEQCYLGREEDNRIGLHSLGGQLVPGRTQQDSATPVTETAPSRAHRETGGRRVRQMVQPNAPHDKNLEDVEGETPCMGRERH